MKTRIAISGLMGIFLASCAVQPKPNLPPGHKSAVTMPANSSVYNTPTVEQITHTLETIRVRLETNAPVQAIMDSQANAEFPPLHYTMGVIDSGLLAAAAATGDKRFDDLPVRQFQFISDHLLQAHAIEAANPGKHGPMWNLVSPNSLDSCGAIGTSMIQAKLAGVGPDMTEVINRWTDYVHSRQYRLPDGTLARRRPFAQSVWLDDAYMGAPILAEMGKLTGNTAFIDDAAQQMKLFYAHLFVPDVGLFTHGVHLADAANQPRYCWGRANGWYAMAIVTVLENLPENHPDRPQLIHIYQHLAKSLAAYQSGTGLWHQMLDRPDSYLETSCTAMFTCALAKGVNHGWLDPGTYGPVAIAGWNGLLTRIDPAGHVTGTCVGTSFAADYIYYYQRPSRDDSHGYGPVLLAGAEMIRLLQNPLVRITGTDPIMINALRREP